MGCIACKGNMASSYRGKMECRLCGGAEETQEHVLNCPFVRGNMDCLDVGILVADVSSADPSEVI